MNASVEISHLREFPQWVKTVAGWHHQEWLRSFRAGGERTSREEVGADIREREHNLRAHFDIDPIPATFIAHLPSVAEEARVPVGSVSLVFYQFTKSRKPSEWVTNLFVEPEHRCRGVGQQLLNYIETYAEGHGLVQLRLYTRDKAAYYQKRDWTFTHNGLVQGNAVSVLEKRVGAER
ncbi:GNAT family N-acetyltransferase [Teredinibacter turnerae]|uniref:GNAT family N-acetyltransferase n=1 Tax=Teredinibacter turnerae TaxID=2426 RepID=UPI000370A1A1|nr:GNAT family N-acetyltransferase [Teredinibacter turnerae]